MLVVDMAAADEPLQLYELTDAQKERVKSAALDDPAVQQFIAGHTWHWERTVPWVLSDSADSLLGGCVRLGLTDGGRTVNSVWPVMAFDDTGTANPPYISYYSDATGSNIRAIWITVSFSATGDAVEEITEYIEDGRGTVAKVFHPGYIPPGGRRGGAPGPTAEPQLPYYTESDMGD
jgi:hypothetical protein